MLIDSHCHLHFPQLFTNIESILKEAEAAGVNLMLTVSTNKDDFHKVIELSSIYSNIYGSIGIHPCHTTDNIIELDELEQNLSHPKIIAIGETGLDFYHTPYNEQNQMDSLIIHIEASRRNNLPLIIHSRNSSEKQK